MLKVVLSGGASRMPRIRQLLEQALPKAEMLDRINPDEVIAQGAAVQVTHSLKPFLLNKVIYQSVTLLFINQKSMLYILCLLFSFRLAFYLMLSPMTYLSTRLLN